MELKEKEVRKIIVHKYLKNTQVSLSSIAKSLKFIKTTVYEVIKRFQQYQTIEKTKGFAKARHRIDKKLINNVRRSFQKNPSLSDKDRALWYTKFRSFILRLRSKLGSKSYRSIKYPNRAEKSN